MRFIVNHHGDFFVSPAPELRKLLLRFLDQLARSLQKIESRPRDYTLLLAGGYGRGEGGVFFSAPDAQPSLYNDLEFYLFTSNTHLSPEIRDWIQHWSHAGEEETGIEVEFKWMPKRALAAAGSSMFTYDLLSAHHVVYGDTSWLQDLPDSLTSSQHIPLHEATRLLFNRGSTHYFASFALAHNTERSTSGYVERLQGKIKLALGDAVLVVHGQYHHSCLERENRLQHLNEKALPACIKQIKIWHAIGVQFKLNPSYPDLSPDEILSHHEELRDVWEQTYLWLESIRLKTTFKNLREYAESPVNLLPHIPLWKRVAVKIRDQLRHQQSLPCWQEYPRASLMRILALLQLNEREPHFTTITSLLPGLKSPSDLQIHDAYRKWWHRYN